MTVKYTEIFKLAGMLATAGTKTDVVKNHTRFQNMYDEPEIILGAIRG